MHYNITWDAPDEVVSKLVTEMLLRIYEEYKDDTRIFPKENKEQT